MEPGVVIIGAGPAGLTAAYLLAKENIPVTVLESDPNLVGGIARTVTYKGFCFDIGGHRFFSKSKEVEDFWTEILPNDLLHRPRSSRIFYNKKFFSYPLKLLEVLIRLGLIESTFCVLSYLKARIKPIKQPKSFSDWVTNQFGRRLYSIFFKTYTEKVWGMRCEDISADWAAQRIKGLSFFSAVLSAILPKKKNAQQDGIIKTLIDSFRYPRKGPGMLWEECANKIKALGGKVELGQTVIHCYYDKPNCLWTTTYKSASGELRKITSTHLVSSTDLRNLTTNFLTPPPPPKARLAAEQLKYRDFLIVALILKDKQQFSDNWIYIHDPTVDVARIQNFKSWSPDMVPDPIMSCYGLEYFCFEHDGLWAATDDELISKAKRELIQVGIAKAEDIVDGCVIRQAKAYPVYDEHYKTNVATIRAALEEQFPTLHLVGRNGMHKYNNQDHAMMTAMLTVKNILAGKNIFDVWNVNQDAEYHESGQAAELTLDTGLRSVPTVAR